LSLENLLRQTAKVGGRELRLIPGRRLVIVTPAGEREVQGPEQSAETIRHLLAPILNPAVIQALQGGHAEWTVRLKDLGAIHVHAQAQNDGLHATFGLDGEAPPAEETRPVIPDPAPEEAPPPVARASAATPRVPVGSGPTAEMDRFFTIMQEMRASDIHICVGSPPMVRHDGDIKILEGYAPLTPQDTERILLPIAPSRNVEEFKRRSDTDFAYSLQGVGRFRCNFFRDRKGMGGVFRLIPSKLMTAEEMGLSKEILELCHLPKGLVLVTGPTGSGKSTTLAAMLDYVNRTRTDHVITIEDPIEFVHENRKCLVNQRQVGEHTESFKLALRAALREDPDVVLVGELRDLETMAIAIETAETGHLVFGTLHTSSAASTVDRIIDQFPSDQQAQIRVMLAESLKGVISQILCKKIGGGRVAALEVMIGIPSISNLIREAKIFQIPSIIQTGKKHGMMLLNESLLDLVKRGLVDPQEAYARAADRPGLLGLYKRNNVDTAWAGGDAPLS
jgi:twitching motility protein PilT